MIELAAKCNLTPAHCAMLSEAIQTCHDAQCIIDALREIGYPVEDKAAEVAGIRAQAEGLKRVFFPDHN